MQSPETGLGDLRALKPLLIFAIIPVGLALAGAINSAWIPTLTVDANQVAGKHPLVGVVSTLGVLLWAAAAVVCAVAARMAAEHEREERQFFAASCAVTTYLLIDDWLQVHESLVPLHLGLDELVMVVVGAAILLTYLWVFYPRLMREPARARLGFALVCLGLSVSIDIVAQKLFGSLGHWEYLFEDGLKWMGIAAWLTFFWDAAIKSLSRPD
jgi:hypothetical protein